MNPIMAGWSTDFFKRKSVSDESAAIEPDPVSNQCSQQARCDKKPRIILFPSNQDIKLHESKNAWRPSFKVKHIPDEIAVLKAHIQKLSEVNRVAPMSPMPVKAFDPFMPNFTRGGNALRPPHPAVNRHSQQGRNTKPNPKSFSSNPKVEHTPDETAELEELKKRVRGILNKLTPQKFEALVTQVRDELNIDTEEKLKVVIDLIFEKAIDEPNFSALYASMCKSLALLRVPQEGSGGQVQFRKLLLTKCQHEFKKDRNDELQREDRKNTIEAADADKRKELLLEFEEHEKKMRMRQLGNIRFIGELFKLGMLIEPIMHECIKKMLSQGDEESLECLCCLLKTIGKELEEKGSKNPRDVQNLIDQYFGQMQKIVDRRLTSSRVRFMLQDVIDLKKDNWVPRRDENNPKTIDQIHKEAEREARKAQQVYQNMSYSNKRPPDDRRELQSGRNVGVLEHEWKVLTSKRNKGSYNTVDPSKLKLAEPLRSFQLSAYCVEVNPQLHAKIISHGEAIVRKIRLDHNVIINFAKREERMITIIGYENDAKAARYAVLKFVQEQEYMYMEEVQIDSRIHSRITGFSGKNILKLMDEFEVYIRFARPSDPEPDLVIIQGAKEDVLDAKDKLLNLEKEYLQDIKQQDLIRVGETAGFSTKTQCNWFHVYADSFMLLMAFLGLWNLTGFFYPSFLSFILISLYVLNNIQCIQVMFTAGFSTKTQCNWFHFYVDSFMLLMAFLGFWNLTRFFYHPLLSLILISLYGLNNIQYIQVMFIH